MKKILVSGLVNIETSLLVEDFPINYCPIEYPFNMVSTCVSGVGFNIAKALKTLGSSVELLSILGDDLNSKIIKHRLKEEKIIFSHCVTIDGNSSSQSIVLVDKNGRRKIYCDLKNLQELKPLSEENIQLDNYSLVILTNINFNRNLLKIAKDKNIKIVSDVHAISSIEDSYNHDFMKYADILFLSNENIAGRECEFMKAVFDKYHNEIIVCGSGGNGSIIYIGKKDMFIHQKAVAPYGIVSTVGAGDSLLSCFVHFYNLGYPIEKCISLASLFAGIKISKSGGSEGFITAKELLELQ